MRQLLYLLFVTATLNLLIISFSYEYYSHDNTTESSAVSVESMFMTSKELHFSDFSYIPDTQELELSWRVEEDLIPYKCDLLKVSFTAAYIPLNFMTPC